MKFFFDNFTKMFEGKISRFRFLNKSNLFQAFLKCSVGMFDRKADEKMPQFHEFPLFRGHSTIFSIILWKNLLAVH